MATTQKFTNSSLVTYTKLSPNHSGQRKHDIDRITPHCFVGQVSAERIGREFEPKKKAASCNYGIAFDGQVVLVVDEKNRTWCSSSSENDNRAVTIECASGAKSPYEFKDRVYEKLILLCADICQRYGKKKLLWINDKNKALAYKPKEDEMLLTVHNWFRPDKSCLPIETTELLTQHGWVKLKDIKKGDIVATVSLDNLQVIFAPVKDKIDTFTKNTYTVCNIEATPDHRLLWMDKKYDLGVDYLMEVMNQEIYIPSAGYINNHGLSYTDEEIINLANTESFTWDLLNLDSDQAVKLIHELCKANGNYDNFQWYCNNRSDKDIITAVACINGIGVTEDEKSLIFREKEMELNSKRKKKRNPETEVSCVTVDTGFIIIRQNNRTAIVGNCPGPWLMNRMADLAKRVTMHLNSTFDNNHEENEKPIWDFLMDKIGNPYGVAGLMGNLYVESGLDPMNLSNDAELTIGVDDEEYTRMVDNGDYSNFVKDKAGYGIARWWFHTRKQELLYYAQERDSSIGDLNMQLEYLWKELQHWTSVLKVLKSATTVKKASDAVMLNFLNVSDKGETNKNVREEYGTAFYNKYVNSKPEFKPYKVQVTTPALNCRKGPGTEYPVVATIRNQGIYTIVEESDGKGAKKWGKLKSGIWFSLDYTKKV